MTVFKPIETYADVGAGLEFLQRRFGRMNATHANDGHCSDPLAHLREALRRQRKQWLEEQVMA